MHDEFSPANSVKRSAEPVLAVQQLTVRREGAVILRDISFNIEVGACIAIVGPNGAGKTTLMEAMLGLLPVEAGGVRLHDRPVRTRGDRRRIARQIAYVPQRYEGFTGFVVHDIVAAARYAKLGRLAWYTVDDARMVERALAACGVTHLAWRPVGCLSAGERQKVWLAAAIAQQCPILFLDEPTTTLDPKHQHDLIHMLRRHHLLGNTLVIISHDLNVAAALDSRVIALRNGRLKFDDPIQEFLQSKHLREVFGIEFDLLHTKSGSLRVVPDV